MFIKRPATISNFRKQLSQLRKANGLTEQELGNKIGVSKRVIPYYEGETTYSPAHLIAPLARALKVATDELLGIKKVKQKLDPQFAALWRKMKKAEKLPKSDQKALVHYLNALLLKTNSHKNPSYRISATIVSWGFGGIGEVKRDCYALLTEVM